jgi:CRP-like cAMP-binding protein
VDATETTVKFLESTDLFSGLSHRTLKKLVQAGAELRFPPGEKVTVAGESVAGARAFSQRGVLFHLVLEGSADVLRGGTAIARIGPGEYFGEISLIDGGPRTTDVVAGPDGMTTFAIEKWTFRALLEEHPEIAIPMLTTMAGKLRAAESRT